MTRVLTLFLLLSVGAMAQPVRMVKDLNPGPDSGFPFADPQFRIYAGLDSACIFLASGKGNIRLVCSSDGTDLGTISLLPPLAAEDEVIHGVVSGNQFWFVIRDADDHDKLYSTDGTWSGTQLRIEESAARITGLRAFPGGVVYSRNPDNFDPEALVRVRLTGNTMSTSVLALCDWFGGLRGFAVQDSTVWAVGSQETVSDRYLFKCTGAANSRTDIALINTGSEFNQNVYMTAVGTKCFWFWKKGSEPYSLWVSDGTAAGTMSLKDFETPFFQDLIEERAIIAFQNKLYFQGENQASGVGQELWVSDGTVAGTKLVKDLAAGFIDGAPHNMTILGNRLFFSGINDLWNTRLFTVAANSATEAYSGFAANEYFGSSITAFNDSLFFDGYRANTGSELMAGSTGAGSVRVVSTESAPGASAFGPGDLAATKKQLFFSASKPNTGTELWLYDPAAAVSGWTTVPIFEKASVSPNPATANISIDLPTTFVGNCRISVFNSSGQLMRQITGSQSGAACEMSVETFAEGAYQMIIQDSQGRVATTRVLVVK